MIKYYWKNFPKTGLEGSIAQWDDLFYIEVKNGERDETNSAPTLTCLWDCKTQPIPIDVDSLFRCKIEDKEKDEISRSVVYTVTGKC